MFSGFPPEAIAFFRSLKRNNKRDWFQPRKHIFNEKVRGPMIELVETLNSELRHFDPQHITDPPKAIFRIYRDTRFSNDKTPYKTHIGAFFPRRGHQKNGSAGYYVAISGEGVQVAGGLHGPSPQDLFAFRTWMAGQYAEFGKAAGRPSKLMGALTGSSLQRMPKGFPSDHPAAGLLKMKQWYYYKELDAKLAMSPKLAGEVVKRFKAMSPVLEMLNRPLKPARKPILLSDHDVD